MYVDEDVNWEIYVSGSGVYFSIIYDGYIMCHDIYIYFKSYYT